MGRNGNFLFGSIWYNCPDVSVPGKVLVVLSRLKSLVKLILAERERKFPISLCALAKLWACRWESCSVRDKALNESLGLLGLILSKLVAW
jgi:hypothetical protein